MEGGREKGKDACVLPVESSGSEREEKGEIPRVQEKKIQRGAAMSLDVTCLGG